MFKEQSVWCLITALVYKILLVKSCSCRCTCNSESRVVFVSFCPEALLKVSCYRDLGVHLFYELRCHKIRLCWVQRCHPHAIEYPVLSFVFSVRFYYIFSLETFLFPLEVYQFWRHDGTIGIRFPLQLLNVPITYLFELNNTDSSIILRDDCVW